MVVFLLILLGMKDTAFDQHQLTRFQRIYLTVGKHGAPSFNAVDKFKFVMPMEIEPIFIVINIHLKIVGLMYDLGFFQAVFFHRVPHEYNIVAFYADFIIENRSTVYYNYIIAYVKINFKEICKSENKFSDLVLWLYLHLMQIFCFAEPSTILRKGSFCYAKATVIIMILYCEKNALFMRKENELLKVEPWGENGLRVRATLLCGFTGSDHALEEDASRNGLIEISDDSATVTNGKISCIIGNSGGLTFCKDGEIVLSERIKSHMAPARSYDALGGDEFRISQYFASDINEKFYGMGQYQQSELNLKGCILELVQRNTQVSVPFAISSKGYGILWNNPGIGEAVFGNNFTRYTSEVSEEIDYYICVGDTPKAIIETYTSVVGRAPEFPESALGLWQSKLRYRTPEEVLGVAREYKRRGAKLDVIVIDYFHWSRFGDWEFDTDYWPASEAMTKELHDMGVKCMVSVWPAVDRKNVRFKEMSDLGLLIHGDRGTGECMYLGHSMQFIDPFNPRTREYVWDKLKSGYITKGVDLFWLDCAEPEFMPADFKSYRYFDGAAMKVNNKYPKMYTKMVYDGLRSEGRNDIVTLVRSAWVGSQKYGALLWSGDVKSTFDALREQLTAGLNVGLAGIPWWTTDTGGFVGNINDPGFNELLIRWFQFSTFCPVLRMHGDRKPRTTDRLEKNPDKDSGAGVSSSGQPNELWSYGDDVYEILKKYLDIRVSMKDYIKGLMDEAGKNGSPIIRTMFYEFPDDPKCWDLTDQYMFGDRYLVAPVMYEGMRSREVYLPAGEWKSIHGGAAIEGGRTLTVDAPLDVIPVFELV